VIVAICGSLFLLLAFRLNRSVGADGRAARSLFVFSIFYLFVLFAALLIDHGSGPFSPMWSSSHGGRGAPVHAERLPGADRSAVNFSEV
jgi:protoheme IX farnesyltransferase